MAAIGRPPKVSHEQIIDASAKIFALNGFERTRLEDIAKELEITKGAIYYRFPSKQLLLEEVHSALLNRALELVRPIFTLVEEPKVKLKMLVYAHLQVQDELPHHATTWLQRISGKDHTELREVRALREEYETIWAKNLQNFANANKDVKLLTNLIFGALNGTHIWFHPGRSLSRDALKEYAAYWVVSGVTGIDETV